MFSTDGPDGVRGLPECHRSAVRLAILGGDLPDQAVQECLHLVRAAHRHLPALVLPGAVPPKENAMDQDTMLLRKPTTLSELEQLAKEIMSSKTRHGRASPISSGRKRPS